MKKTICENDCMLIRILKSKRIYEKNATYFVDGGRMLLLNAENETIVFADADYDVICFFALSEYGKTWSIDEDAFKDD